MSVNDLKVKLEVKGYEKLKECADNVIGTFIMMNEAIEEMSGCMLELKVSDPDVNENLVTEAVDMEDKTTVTTASETKEAFNAEEIVEDMILKLKENFNECLLKKEISGSFDRAMIVSEEIRKLMECLMMVRDTSDNCSGNCEVYWVPRLDKSIEVGSNSGVYVQSKDNEE